MAPRVTHHPHEFIDLFLAALNVIIGLLTIFILLQLIRLYRIKQKEAESMDPFLKNAPQFDNLSFSYQSELALNGNNDIKETKYVIYFAFIGILCICISSISGAIFYSETFFSYQSPLSAAAFESIYELFWNLGEISCYCLFVDRLKFSFKNTSHSISTINFILFRIAIAIYLVCALIFALYEFDSVSSSFDTNELFSWIYVFGIETSLARMHAYAHCIHSLLISYSV